MSQLQNSIFKGARVFSAGRAGRFCHPDYGLSSFTRISRGAML
jgi:hypothetical protein